MKRNLTVITVLSTLVCLASSCVTQAPVTNAPPPGNVAPPPNEAPSGNEIPPEPEVPPKAIDVNHVHIDGWREYISFSGESTLPDGTYLQTQLYEHEGEDDVGKPASWWPADEYVQVQDGKWQIKVSFTGLSKDVTKLGIGSTTWFVFKVWQKDTPAVEDGIAFDRIGPPPVNESTIQAQIVSFRLKWDEDITFIGESTLPDGTYIQAQLYAEERGEADAKPAAWWPADAYVQVQDGKWQITVSLKGLSEDVTKIYFGGKTVFSLKFWEKDNPAATDTFGFDLTREPPPLGRPISIIDFHINWGEDISFRGISTLPDGTYIQTQLYADNQPALWWPTDEYVQVQGGRWQITVSLIGLSEDTTRIYFGSETLFMLKYWERDKPATRYTFGFNLIEPPLLP